MKENKINDILKQIENELAHEENDLKKELIFYLGIDIKEAICGEGSLDEKIANLFDTVFEQAMCEIGNIKIPPLSSTLSSELLNCINLLSDAFVQVHADVAKWHGKEHADSILMPFRGIINGDPCPIDMRVPCLEYTFYSIQALRKEKIPANPV